MLDVFGLPIKYYKKEGLSTSSIAYTGALLAALGGIINMPNSIQRSEGYRPIHQKTSTVNACLIFGGFYAANIFLRNAGLLTSYNITPQS